MVTLCTAEDVTDRCGLNANATFIASAAIVERFIAISEQTIVAETRRDWIDSYASVPDSVKETLRICAASDSANAIIKYDMSGFTTRAEAITMLNVNLNDFNRTLKALKELDITDIRSI